VLVADAWSRLPPTRLLNSQPSHNSHWSTSHTASLTSNFYSFSSSISQMFFQNLWSPEMLGTAKII
jgi:hypothetical protein